MIWLVIVVVVVLIARWMPSWRAQSVEDRRRQLLVDAGAEVADLLVALLSAGNDVLGALRWLADRGPPVTSSAFRRVVEQVEGGRPLTAALRSLAVDLGPSYRPLVSALIAAVDDGSPTTDLLLRLSDEARRARRHLHERRARALPVRLLFPLVMCSLPAVVIGAVVPLALVALGRL